MRERFENGKVSVIILTYNRSDMVCDTIESLMDQSHKNVEIIVVDNASTDNSKQVLERYKTEAYQNTIKIYHLEHNLRFTGGANFALDKISGEWFTFLDDDDTAHPKAFEMMLRVVEQIDPAIDAITCNVIDSSTEEFAGFGVEKDQHLSFQHLVRHCSGEFWGITKSKLLNGIRFNEALIGVEDTFWYKISAKANRYYIHQGLRVWTTHYDSNMTSLLRSKDRKLKAKVYKALVHEDLYWESLANYHPKKFRSKCLKGLIYAKMDDDRETASKYLGKLSKSSQMSSIIGRTSMSVPRTILKSVFYFIPF